MERSKFNVDKDKEKRTYNNIVFDSQLEMKYYRDVLCPAVESSEVTYFELQKKYELQPKYTHNGKTVLPIIYVADFYMEYADGHIEVVDTKGCPDSVAKLKRKLFWYIYPDIDYKWITYVQKWGGWLEYEVVKEFQSHLWTRCSKNKQWILQQNSGLVTRSKSSTRSLSRRCWHSLMTWCRAASIRLVAICRSCRSLL